MRSTTSINAVRRFRSRNRQQGVAAIAELTTARFTGDATVTNAQRMDYAGGLQNGRFYMRNGGFFSPYVPVNQTFTRPATGVAPAVDVNSLPQ